MIFDRPVPPPEGPAVSPRRGCQDRIDRHVALAAYLKSKLGLQPSQRELWRKIEDAAEPALESLRAICAQLPDHPIGPPSIGPDMIDFAQQDLSARVALLRAIREPVRAFYDTLSLEQRALLQAPPLPLLGGPP